MRAKLTKNLKVVYAIEACILLAALGFFVSYYHMSEITRSYLCAMLFASLALVAHFALGKIRDKNHLLDSAVRVVIANCLLYFIVTNFCGLMLGFSKSYASLKISKIMAAFVPVCLQVVFTEILRFKISSVPLRNKYPVVIFTILVIVLNFILGTDPHLFENAERTFIFISSVSLPMAACELSSAYLSYNFGLRPALIYKVIISLYPYIFPIIPNLGPYLQSVFSLFLAFSVFLSCSKLRVYYDKDRSRFTRYSLGVFTIPLVIVCGLLAILVSGIFNYKIIAIGSNSMAPLYERGDAVIFKKLTAEEVQEGDILVFDNGSRVVTHRVIRISKENGTLNFTTKGDANNAADTDLVKPPQVIGKVVLYSKYIGFPTLWFNDLMNGNK